MKPFYAGGDWSGQPAQLDRAFIFCIVALSDAQAWSESCRQLRQELRMPQSREFHGHEMEKPEQRLKLLEMGQAAGMKVGALVVTRESRAPTSETLDYQSIALEMLTRFFARYALRDLWCDNEIQGDEAQKAFETQVKRCHRAIHPKTRFNARLRPSHSSDLIQLADGMAYALRTQAQGTLKSPALRQFLKQVAEDGSNLIIWR